MSEPIAWADIENAMTRWVRVSTGFASSDVRLVPQRATGAARGPAPKVQITLLSMEQLSQVMKRRLRLVQQERYTVTADGPGTVGVDFFPGHSLIPLPIAYVAGGGELPASSAAGLLAELIANLPAGYTAVIDPADSASVLVNGSTAEPIFAALPLPAGVGLDPITAVVDSIPNTVDIRPVLIRLIWRLTFRSGDTHGAGQATNPMMRCITLRQDALDPTMRTLGFWSENTAASASAITPDRVESVAIYDARMRGHMTLAVARIAGRALAYNVSAQLAA